MVSDRILSYIGKMDKASQTKLGREMLELKAQGTPEELIDGVMEKRLGIVEEKLQNGAMNGEIKQALGEILTNVKEHKKEINRVKEAISGIQVYNTDLPPIGPADLGIRIDAPVDIGKNQTMTSKIVSKEETKKDDTSDIVSMLRSIKKETK